MRLRLLAVLAIALSVTACGTSSTLDNSPPPDLAGAEARAQEAVDHPQLPPDLQLCLDGTQPWTEPSPGAENGLVYRCPIPPALKSALDNGAPMDVVASAAIAALQTMTDRHFQANHWSDHRHGAPAPAEPPAAKQDKPKPPSWQFWNW